MVSRREFDNRDTRAKLTDHRREKAYRRPQLPYDRQGFQRATKRRAASRQRVCEKRLDVEPFAQAAWHFFAHFEDHFARQYVGAPNDELHYHAFADNLINHSHWAMKWLSTTCPPSNKTPPAYDDALYSHAMQLSELAMDYGPFTAAYTYATRGLVSLLLEGSRIRTSGPMIDDARYKAYDHVLTNKSDSSVLDGFDPSLMEKVRMSLRVRGHSFDYSLNPKIVQRAVESLGPAIDARFSLPGDWTFAMFSLDEFRRRRGCFSLYRLSTSRHG